MQKPKKTAKELEAIISEKSGVNVKVIADKARGWHAIAIVTPSRISQAQASVDPIARELRAQFDLKD